MTTQRAAAYTRRRLNYVPGVCVVIKTSKMTSRRVNSRTYVFKNILDLSNVNKTLVPWRVDNSQIVVRRQTLANFCGVCRGTFEMSGSSAIRPYLQMAF